MKEDPQTEAYIKLGNDLQAVKVRIADIDKIAVKSQSDLITVSMRWMGDTAHKQVVDAIQQAVKETKAALSADCYMEIQELLRAFGGGK